MEIMQNLSTQHANFIKTLDACRRVLSSGDRDINQWRKKSRATIQALVELVNNSNQGGAELGLSIPLQITMELIDFAHDLERAYLWNDISTITALPAPSSWQNKLKQFADDLKSKAPPKKRTARKIDIAITIIVREPDLVDAEVARRAGCSSSYLTKSKEYQRNADMARRALERVPGKDRAQYDVRTRN
jgi:hypothetical protein